MATQSSSFILSLSSASSSSLFLDNHASTTDASCRFRFVNKHVSSLHIFSSNREFEVRAVRDKSKDIPSPTSTPSSPDQITKKYGLEAGLWKIFSSKEGEEGIKEKSKSEQAKELLTKYGGAYLATSITLSLISFTLCYALISAGVDVSTLLQKGFIPNS